MREGFQVAPRGEARFQIEFWKVALLPLFLFAGLPLKAGIRGALSIAFLPLLSVNDGFTASFLVFYLAIPFLKLLIDSGGRNLHAAAVALLLAVDTVSFTFFRNSAAFRRSPGTARCS